MKKNTTFSVSPSWLLLALILGIGLGYLLFYSPPTRSSVQEEPHLHGSEDTWTCSMHPQIRQDEPGSCPICGMDLIPLEQNSSSDPLVLEMTPEAVRLAQVQTYTVGDGVSNGEKSGSENVLRLSGKIQVDERRSANQVTHIPGRIEKLYISFEGESVRKGQRVARLYAPELVTAQKELLEATKLKERNPRFLEAARRKLLNWKIPQSQIDQIEAAGEIQETFDLLADVAGVVSTRKVSEGDHLEQGESLFEVINLEKVWAVFDAYEEDLGSIQLGDRVQFSVAAIPNQRFETRVSFIDPVIHPQTRVASIRGDISNAKGILKPEMFVQGSIQSPIADLGSNRSLMVPKSAILWTGKRSIVYVKVPEASIPSYRYTEVQLGDPVGEYYAIESGLSPGDEVVHQGSFAIDAAAQLNNQRSMMNQWVRIGSEEENPIEQIQISEAFQGPYSDLLDSYLALKDTFVLSRAESAQKAANVFLSRLDTLNQTFPGEAAKDFWTQKHPKLKKEVLAIYNTSDLAKQREAFEVLSNSLIEVVQVLPLSDTLYIQHCPMAFEFQGADWLSREKNILNPYFGDEMLTCGSVTGEIR